MARPDKVAAVDEIAERFRGATASVVTEYRGLTMTQLIALRRSLGTDTTYRVAKNTLVKRAAEDAGLEGLDPLLVGPTAIAFITGEPVDAAKALRDFAKDNKGLVIKGGYMDGRALTAPEVASLADLESREVLLAKLAGAMKANLSKAAGLFAAPASQVARLAQALADKRQEEEGAPAGRRGLVAQRGRAAQPEVLGERREPLGHPLHRPGPVVAQRDPVAGELEVPGRHCRPGRPRPDPYRRRRDRRARQPLVGVDGSARRAATGRARPLRPGGHPGVAGGPTG